MLTFASNSPYWQNEEDPAVYLGRYRLRIPSLGNLSLSKYPQGSNQGCRETRPYLHSRPRLRKIAGLL